MKPMETNASSVNSFDYINRRHEPRINLPFTLFLRRSINKPSFMSEAITENVSREGARIITSAKFDVGTLIEIMGFNGRFSALAMVANICERDEGNWALGLNFIKKNGKWIVN